MVNNVVSDPYYHPATLIASSCTDSTILIVRECPDSTEFKLTECTIQHNYYYQEDDKPKPLPMWKGNDFKRRRR